MNILFPYDKQEILIDAPKDRVTAELKQRVEVSDIHLLFDSWLFQKEKSKPFYGTSESEVWKIKVKTDYYNSFKPIVYVKLVAEGDMTRMILEFKLPLIAKIFAVIFLIFATIMLIVNILNHHTMDAYYLPIGIIAFIFIFSRIAFYMSLDHTAEAINHAIRDILVELDN